MIMNRFSSQLSKVGFRSAQSGRTLIELIIAIAISLVIVAGVASLYLSSSQMSRVSNQVGAVEDAGQLALFAVGDSIRMAGFGEIVGSSTTATWGQTQFEGPQIRACTSGTFTAPWAATPDLTCVPTGAGTPDSLWVGFQSNNVKASPQSPLADCLGQDFDQLNPAHMTTITRFGGPSLSDVPVVQNVFAVNAAGDLACAGKFGAVVGAAAALVGNTENFKVFFGFDNVRFAGGQIDLVPMARQWVDAAALNAMPMGPIIVGSPRATAWDHVVSVLVCVTVVTNETGLTTQAATTRARCPATAAEVATGVDGGGLPLTVVDNDGFIRRTFSQVFAIRANAGAFAAFN